MRSVRKAHACSFLLALLSALAAPVHAAELKQKTVEAFDRYIRATEARIAEELRDANAFLWVDHMPVAQREQVYSQLREARIYLEQVNTLEKGKPIEIPSGLIHHWLGVAFFPGVRLQRTLAVIQDYDHHQVLYKPDVQRSKLLQRDGDTFRVYMRLYKKSLVTVVLNAEYEVRYFTDDATRIHSRSYSTRIAEVEDPGEANEHEKPVGNDHGYLWRLYSYWRFQEKDGGVYVQLESIALTRGVPAIFAWLINPLLRSIPRDALSRLLSATRSAVIKRSAAETARPAAGALGALVPGTYAAETECGCIYFLGSPGPGPSVRSLWLTACGNFTVPLGALAPCGHQRWKMTPSVCAAASAIAFASSGVRSSTCTRPLAISSAWSW